VNTNRPRSLALLLAAWALFWPAPPAGGEDKDGSRPRIRLNARGKGPATVDVEGLSGKELSALARLGTDSPRWPDVFAVYVERGGKVAGGQPPVLGSYSVEGKVLRFEPRFPLAPGVRYRAVFRPAGGAKPVEARLFVPKPGRRPTTVVTHVYPSAGRLPENQLKFYLHFSSPMRRGEAYRHIQLLDEKGKGVDLPFLELDEELWDPSGKRFTLFFDPGRIKRGLKPREEVGPALVRGKRYTLVVDRAWRDEEGNPLKESFRKTFDVTAPDDTPPDPKAWKLAPPAAGTRAPLRVTFPEPMDHALLHRLVWVTDPGGRKVAGTAAVGANETRWSFTPDKPWPAGSYHLVADTRLEDLAGNSIGRPFEVDEFRRVDREVKAETVKVPFEVKARR
jgi:hypothetical protein